MDNKKKKKIDIAMEFFRDDKNRNLKNSWHLFCNQYGFCYQTFLNAYHRVYDKDPLDEIFVKNFEAKSVWSGDTVRLKFKNPKTAMRFQNELVKKGCFIKE